MSPPATLALRVYYEDTDFSGFVYHARYLHFFDRGRTEALREHGVDQRSLFEAADGPFAFVVRHMSIDYLAPARMDDEVVVETRLSEMGGARFTMQQQLRRGETILARAAVRIAHLRAGRAARLTPALQRLLAAWQQGQA